MNSNNKQSSFTDTRDPDNTRGPDNECNDPLLPVTTNEAYQTISDSNSIIYTNDEYYTTLKQ